MSDVIHKSALSALTGMLVLLPVFDAFAQMPDFSITDSRDSKVYPIVHIGHQWWTAKNLDIGEMISGSTEMTDNSIIEKYCIDNNPAFCNIYGGLYQWNELMQYTVTESAQGICPDGWHIPSDGEWKSLEAALGMPQASIDSTGYRGTVEGGMLKQEGTGLWFEPNVGATNEVGFNLLPAGGRSPDGTIGYDGEWTDFWTSTEYSENDSFAHWRMIVNSSSKIFRSVAGYKPHGTSARCLKNTPDYYETGEFTDDRNGSVYKTVLIGGQWWMANNLNIGDRINALEQQTNNTVIEKYCYYDDDAICDDYGGLYTWDEAMQYTTDSPQGICPDGWHIPSDNEWKKLEAELGMDGIEIQSTGWARGTYEGIFLQMEGGSGFDAILGGGTNPSGDFNNMDLFGYYWSSDAYNTNYSWGRVFGKDSVNIARNNYYYKADGFSVRCLMDTDTPIGIEIVAPDTVCASHQFNITATAEGGAGSYSFSWTSDPPGAYPAESTIAVAPVTDTRYILAVDDGVRTARDSILVIVNPLPVIDLTGPTEICAGEEESTAYSTPNNLNYLYSWTTDNGEITSAADISQIVVNWVSTAQTRTLNLVVADKTTGCLAEQQISVDVMPLPEFSITGPTLLCAGEDSKVYSTVNSLNYEYDWYTDNGEITTAADINQIGVNWGADPGTKTLNLVIADKTTGCLAGKQISVEVKSLPAFNISGTTELCAGEDPQTYSTVSNLNYQYDWYTDNGQITTASDIYQIHVNWGTTPGSKTLDLNVMDNTTGCSQKKQISLEVKPSPEKPVVKLKGGYIFICTDSGLVYQWYHNGILIQDATKQFYCAGEDDKNELIVVETSLDNGCTNVSEPYLFSKKSSVYNDDPIQNRVFINPNPNNGLVTIEILDDYTGCIDVQIINSLGQVIKKLQITKQEEMLEKELDLKQLVPGLYFMFFKYGGYSEIQRIIINGIN
jgi:uncharacterized protein (TIGR02145 family)